MSKSSTSNTFHQTQSFEYIDYKTWLNRICWRLIEWSNFSQIGRHCLFEFYSCRFQISGDLNIFSLSARQVLIEKWWNRIKFWNAVFGFCLVANLYNCSLNVVAWTTKFHKHWIQISQYPISCSYFV